MRPTLPRLLLCLSLLGFGSVAMAAESRHMGPDGGGAQSDTGAASERIDEADEAGNASTRRSADAKSRQTGAGSRNGSATRSNAPRWHSFLPGMIR